MKIFVDIDETICSNNSQRDYAKAKPIKTNILAVNKLFEDGHEITYWSARGSGTGIDWNDITKAQFKEWGVKYHFLILGKKPIYDLLIDDKAINTNNLDQIQKFINDF
tara:strand:- start:510 stop:833 length:324 start_codon:yes stop_codon:yes gene_type:complete